MYVIPICVRKIFPLTCIKGASRPGQDGRSRHLSSRIAMSDRSVSIMSIFNRKYDIPISFRQTWSAIGAIVARMSRVSICQAVRQRPNIERYRLKSGHCPLRLVQGAKVRNQSEAKNVFIWLPCVLHSFFLRTRGMRELLTQTR